MHSDTLYGTEGDCSGTKCGLPHSMLHVIQSEKCRRVDLAFSHEEESWILLNKEYETNHCHGNNMCMVKSIHIQLHNAHSRFLYMPCSSYYSFHNLILVRTFGRLLTRVIPHDGLHVASITCVIWVHVYSHNCYGYNNYHGSEGYKCAVGWLFTSLLICIPMQLGLRKVTTVYTTVSTKFNYYNYTL